MSALTLLLLPLAASAEQSGTAAGRPMVVIDERATVREEAPPHGAIGMSTAFRISDGVPARSMEFRKRILHKGAAIGDHRIDHDEVYYVLSGKGVVRSGGRSQSLTPGMAAYLYRSATVGIRQVGREPLALIISYPLAKPTG
jgi:mannose-6-phosphate isomerase-like protein (cupin superfamily)